MLRVANVIEEGRWGGPQKRIALVARALRSHGIETDIILPSRESEHFRNCLDEYDLKYVMAPLHRLGRSPAALLAYVFTFLPDIHRLRKILKTGAYDLVHVSGGAWQIKGVLAAYSLKLPVIWHLNDTSMPKSLIYLFRKLAVKTSAFFVAARKTMEYYLQFPELEAIPRYLVPAPVDTGFYNKNKVEAASDVEAFKYPRIITVCNINPIKGLDILVDAARIFKNSVPEFSLLIVGPKLDTQKAYFETLQNRIRENDLVDNVVFIGARTDIPGIMKAADLYVCSSRAEASPLSVWEAMSMELPVISTAVGDVPYYIEDGKDGIIVPSENARALADAMLSLINDQKRKISFTESARKKICRELDVAVIAKITADAYQAVSGAVQLTGNAN